jgi:hypothetical protein
MSSFRPVAAPTGLIIVAVICSFAAKDFVASAGLSQLASMAVGLSIGFLIISIVFLWKRGRNGPPKVR